LSSILIQNLANELVSTTKHVGPGSRRYSYQDYRFFIDAHHLWVYIKLLGLSEMEMLDVLHNIHDEQLDTAAGGTLIQDYKERRCLLLIQ